MLPNVQYSIKNQECKNPTVFPPLLGSRKRIDNEKVMRKAFNNSGIKQSPQNQLDFLNRMKKAKQLILNHQKRNKLQLEDSHRRKFRAKTEQICQNKLPLSSREARKMPCSFSQVVYNIHDSNWTSAKTKAKRSMGNQLFNDKMLRQCKSEFMSKQKKQLPLLIPISKKTSHLLSENKEQSIYSGNKFFSQIMPTKSKNRKILQENSTEQYLMRFNLEQDLISENGNLLVEKLKKCQQKNKDNKKLQQEKEKSNTEHVSIDEQKQRISANNLSFNKQLRKVNRTQLQLLYQKKQKKNNLKKIKISFRKAKQLLSQNSQDCIKVLKDQNKQKHNSQQKKSEMKDRTMMNFKNFKSFRIKTTPQNQTNSNIQTKENPQNKQELKQQHKGFSEGSKQKTVVKQIWADSRQQKKKQRMTDMNYKIEGWNLKETLDYQIF